MGTAMSLPRTSSLSRTASSRDNRQRGAVVPIFVVVLVVILGFMGLSLDGSRLFNRRVELQAVADFAALSAAQKLSGTAAGIDDALAAAADSAAGQTFSYGKSSIDWSSSAVKFSSSPDSGWVNAAAAKTSPGNVYYVQVDTGGLSAASGKIQLMFTKMLSDDSTASTSARAVAGRSTINLTPLAICAMSDTPAASRPPLGELVQYGFRRGVGYDLMQLNSDGMTAANFIINPIDLGTGLSGAGNTSVSVVAPFVCAGAMPAVGGPGGMLKVERPFPLGSLYQHLNSRFGQYPGDVCDFRSAPPDRNVKSFAYDASPFYMKTTPSGQTAQSLIASERLQTIADPVPHPASNTAPMYGQMWSYARPVPYSQYVPGVPEPNGGYTPFSTSAWPALYAPGAPEPRSSYPTATPYLSGGPFQTAASASFGRGLRHRRVLNVALLDCPVNGSNATVLAIGRFFMTVPATPTRISAEFAGLASGNALRGPVELIK